MEQPPRESYKLDTLRQDSIARFSKTAQESNRVKQGKSTNLIAERFPCTCEEDQQSGLQRQYTLDSYQLPCSKRFVPKYRLQYSQQILFRDAVDDSFLQALKLLRSLLHSRWTRSKRGNTFIELAFVDPQVRKSSFHRRHPFRLGFSSMLSVC
jgi:hypothetical protein